ncbi:MAG: Lytic transglycosylase catalytic [Actinomycetia bacterium]|nr:Lytic transglycosylase catalytic [Actinomycetes bacterium]
MTIRRGSLPAVIGVGAVALSIAVAVAIAATSGGVPAGGALGSATRGTTGSVSGASTATGGPGGGNVDSAGMSVSLPAAGGHVAGGADPWASATGSPAGSSTGSGAATSGSAAQAGSPPRQLIVPDIIAAAPGGITAAQIARISKLGQVRAVLPIDGARISVNGRPVNVLAAPAAKLRPWMPPATAASSEVWSEFASGDLIATAAAAGGLGLRTDQSYQVTAATQVQLTFGTDALLGVPGVDGIVNVALGTRLGLVRNVAVLINAPAARMDALVTQVEGVIGSGGQVVRLTPEEVVTKLPVVTQVPKGRPASYLMLYQESAAQYCPGLSWTVLAAIGEIESNNGQNMGPSSAGALGPMQFLPSTWATWGTDGFGDTGPPDIRNPYDAVPSAARMLCADGAAKGGQSLWNAIFDYNHASWYVDEVLTLAQEYAREYA